MKEQKQDAAQQHKQSKDKENVELQKDNKASSSCRQNNKLIDKNIAAEQKDKCASERPNDIGEGNQQQIDLQDVSRHSQAGLKNAKDLEN